MTKTLCPFTAKSCTEEKCIAWGELQKSSGAFDPATGRPILLAGGKGCQFFGKILKEVKK